MNLDVILTGAVVLAALVLVVRKFMKPGCSGCASKGCGCQDDKESCSHLVDLRDKGEGEAEE